jgi:prevent-host-death family protein
LTGVGDLLTPVIGAGASWSLSMTIVYTCGTAYSEAMSELRTESIRDLRAHLAEVVERADRDDQATVITRRGKPVAAVVSIEVLRKYQECEERELNRIIDERMADRAHRVPLEDVIAETLARGG